MLFLDLDNPEIGPPCLVLVVCFVGTLSSKPFCCHIPCLGLLGNPLRPAPLGRNGSTCGVPEGLPDP